MADDRLDWLLGRLRAIPHVEFVRIGTKMPAVLPQRITPAARAHAAALPPAVDEHALHAPRRAARPRSPQACGAAGRRRHPARQPDGAAQGRQRRRRHHAAAHARAAEDPRAALLPLPVRSDLGLGALPHAGARRALEIIERPARPHHRLRRADLRGRRARRRRQDPAAPDYVVGRDGDDLLLRNFEGERLPLPRPGRTPGRAASKADRCASA